MTVFLLGCTTQHAPFQAYEQKVPLSQTAVFMAMNQTGPLIQSRINQTDGKDMPCAVAGCPYWVRVLPGTHSFVLDYRSNFDVGLVTAGAVSWTGAGLEVNVPNMLPKHVYRASYWESDGKVHLNVVDLGENSEVGLDFSYMGYHKARFDDQ